MSTSPETAVPFAYRAQTPEGATVTGTIDASNVDDARWRLKALSLRVFELDPVPAGAGAAPKPARLRAEDFQAFNQQVAQLAAAGMPIESGLRLIARDMRNRRLSAAVEAVAADLERGLPLDEAFGRHSRSFPALYGSVLRAGVRAGDLPGILLNLGRHLELMQQLRRALWRAAAYPLMAFVAFCFVMAFIGYAVAPHIREIYTDLDLPWLTEAVFGLAERMIVIVPAMLGTVLLFVLWLRWLRYSGAETRVADRLVWLPLIGPVIRANLVARWCDAVHLGVGAGLDLPRAVEMAAQATGSPALRADSEDLLRVHNAGQPLKAAPPMRILTPTVLAAADMGRQRGDLQQVLAMLTGVYYRNSEHRMGVAIAVLSPVMLLMMGAMLGTVITAMFLPLIKLIQNVSG